MAKDCAESGSEDRRIARIADFEFASSRFRCRGPPWSLSSSAHSESIRRPSQHALLESFGYH
eukprot:2999677-Alexandrium_andersonii.AAC.1